MRFKINLLFSLFVVFFIWTVPFATAALVYEQLPISWSHHTNNYNLIADDFKLDQSTYITNVEWWGKYDRANSYEIIFYSNIYDSTNGNYEPGASIGNFTTSVTKTDYNDDGEHFIFSANIFFTALADQSYWLSIEPVDETGWTGWRPASSPTVQYFEQYVYYHNTDGWKPYTNDPAYHHDLAFRLNGSPVPIPGAVWLLGSGLIAMVGIRRKFKK